MSGCKLEGDEPLLAEPEDSGDIKRERPTSSMQTGRSQLCKLEGESGLGQEGSMYCAPVAGGAVEILKIC